MGTIVLKMTHSVQQDQTGVKSVQLMTKTRLSHRSRGIAVQDQNKEEKTYFNADFGSKDHASIPKTRKASTHGNGAKSRTDTKGPNISSRKENTSQTKNDSPKYIITSSASLPMGRTL